MSGSNTQRRRRRLTITWLASFAFAIALGLVMWEKPGGLDLPTPLSVALGLVLLAGMLAIQIYYWRTLDELARAIHMRAFFWSGLTTWGLLLVAVLTTPLFQPNEAVLAEIGAIGGAMLVVLMHTLLYLVLWGWGWLRSR